MGSPVVPTRADRQNSLDDQRAPHLPSVPPTCGEAFAWLCLIAMSEKKLTDQQLLGEQGVSLISLAVSGMGFVWRPTSQHDTGIDGEIELRSSTTGAMSGLLLKVQSKAVSAFANDSAENFDYWPEQRDVDYWLKHNVPVILVVSRPNTGEVYWQPVQEPSGQVRSRKFRFNKQRDALDAGAAGRLVELVRQQSAGAGGIALKRPERLVSNLLPVTKLPARLYLADTPYRTPKDVTDALQGRSLSFEFALRNKRVLTVRDLTDPRYEFLCDRGTVEDFPVEQWSTSKDRPGGPARLRAPAQSVLAAGASRLDGPSAPG